MRPFFPFYGSKYRLARHYPAPSGVVVEPFAGSACYATWTGAERAILVDADPNIAAVWHYLLSASAEDIESLPEIHGEGESVDDHDLSDGAKALIGFWLTKGAQPVRRRGAYAANDKWRHLFWRPQIKERISSQLDRIAQWQFIQGDFTRSPRIEDATYFIDPPYQQAGKYYRVKFDRFDELADWSRDLPGRAIVCEGEGATWLPFSPMGDFKTFATGSSPEVVWLNEVAA